MEVRNVLEDSRGGFKGPNSVDGMGGVLEEWNSQFGPGKQRQLREMSVIKNRKLRRNGEEGRRGLYL
ncbi:unnamed protein product [Ilex paraguariensis]|uniref:Uncharacterized protein n=1 Tax=Ilex paraguariensis TaxID=185542 RepID=A0ABC8QPB0_9AQUA